MCDRTGPTRQSVNSHYWRTHTPSGVSHKGGTKPGKIPWNVGKTKLTDARVKKNADAISCTLRRKVEEGTFIASIPGKEYLEKLSIEQTLKNRGGKCKWYKVSGQSVQGTWEKNVAEELIKNNIVWERVKTKNHIFQYILNGKLKRYTPDFYLPQYNLYLEIKGYWWGRDKEKMEAVKRSYPNTKFLVIEKLAYKKIVSGDLSDVINAS
jgi:hypothetical protein